MVEVAGLLPEDASDRLYDAYHAAVHRFACEAATMLLTAALGGLQVGREAEG